MQVAVQEVRRLQRYGVTKPELERYQMALLRDAEQAAEQSTSIPSVEMLEYSMDSIGLDHTVMDQEQVTPCGHLPPPESSEVTATNWLTWEDFMPQTRASLHEALPS